MRLKRFPIFLFFLLPYFSFSQIDSLTVQVRTYGIAGSKGFAPHWITSNRNGIFSDSTGDFLVIPGVVWPMKFGKHRKVDAGFDAALKARIQNSFIYQGYVNVRYGPLKLMMGRQEFMLGQYSRSLSSGSFIVSNNALPIPRIGIGFYDYVDVPFTRGYLQVKGGLNHGWMDNHRLDHSPLNKPLLHEKFAYLRTQKLPVNPFIGITHLALYGGEYADGKKVGIDYKAVFFAKSSSKPGIAGEEINVAGEHEGIMEFGASFKILDYEFTYYYQAPINDRTGYEKNFSRNHDAFAGIVIQTKEKKLISGITYEYNHTDQQGGLGIPDPVVNGKIREPWIESDRQYLKSYYTALGYPVGNLNTEYEWRSFLQAVVNHGYEFGGRVDYYNNYLYKEVYHDRAMGTSLFLTKPELKRISGVGDTGDFFNDNRVIIHHLGIEGYILENLNYRFLLTFTKNLGEWQEYGGRYEWQGIAVDPDYTWYWKGGRIQWYSLLEMGYTNKNLKNLSFTASAGYDFGGIYHNAGFLVGLSYQVPVKF